MKRLLLLLLIPLLGLTGCQQAADEEAAMTIGQAVLSEEEKAILELVQGDESHPLIFDYTADENLQAMAITVYQLDGSEQWQEHSSSYIADAAPQGRVAFVFPELIGGELTIAVQNEKGFSRSHQLPAETPAESPAHLSLSSLQETALIYGQEIPLIVQSAFDQNSTAHYGPDSFFEPELYHAQGLDFVYAITITFSDQN